MPSYIIHYICGKKLIENYRLSPKDKSLFLFGNLIPDTSKLLGSIETASLPGDFRKEHRKEIQKEKISTHFRDEKDIDEVIMLPHPEKFIDKYGISNLISLGYYFHLYTDKYFFEEISKNSFDFLTKDLKKTNSKKESEYIRIRKNNLIIPIKEFYSSKHLYQDYTILNKLLLEYFNISFTENELTRYINDINNYIDEVDFNNIKSVIKDTLFYISKSQTITDNELEVFDKERVINFIEELNKKFIKENQKVIKKVGLKKC